MNEEIEKSGLQQKREDKTINSPVKMGVMIYIITSSTSHVLAIKEINETEKDTGDRHGSKKINLVPRVQEDRGKQHGRHCPGSPNGGIISVIAIFPHVIDRSRNHSPEIETEKCPVPESKHREIALNILPERIEGEHINKQMHPIGMHEPVRDQSPPFIGPGHAIRHAGQLVKQFLVIETSNRNHYRHEYNYQRHIHIILGEQFNK